MTCRFRSASHSRQSKVKALLAAGAVALVGALPIPCLAQAMQMKITFYGFPDNDPPGKQIAFPILHQEAGGTGTFDDPITAATATPANGGRFQPGVRMYVPSLRKYLIVEDSCAACTPDQVDIWMESEANSPSDAVQQCEEAWTPSTPVEVDISPDSGRSVDRTPFFNVDTGTCNI